MSGATVLGYLIANSAPVLAVVPATRILDDDPTPINQVYPLLTIDEIDSVPTNLLSVNELPKMHTDRVQVTAHFKGQYGKPAGTGKAGCKSLLRLVLAACPCQRGTIDGIVVDSIVPDIEGPALHDYETDLWQKSRDFFVKWVQTA